MNEPAEYQMLSAQFQMLEESIRPIIQCENTDCWDSVSAGQRLMVALRFLATGVWVNLGLRGL